MAVAAFAAAGDAGAATTTLAVCGGVTGQGYFLEGGAVPAAEAGWGADAISRGRFTITMSEDRKLDVLYVDATGMVNSATAEGGRVVLLRRSTNEAAVMVLYASSVEIYQLARTPRGLEVVMTQSKGTPLIRKSSVMAGRCDSAAILSPSD